MRGFVVLLIAYSSRPLLLFSGTHVVQDLTFYVGHDLTSHQEKNMANVLKISRGHSMPPTFTNAHEWFHYAFSNNEIKGNPVYRRPLMKTNLT